MNSSRQRISNQATLKEGVKAPPSQYSISLAEFYVKKIILVLVCRFVNDVRQEEKRIANRSNLR